MSADQAPWRRQSSQISANGASSPSPGPPPGAPPPPPPYAVGAIPSSRIPTEISCRKEPPAAIQNAMMTKDKKPFTYTPGGLDLAEIRSPRMAKRLSRNAHLEDSCTGAAAAAAQSPPLQPHQLPPQALAAMQPQIAVAVLPPGAALPKPHGSPPVNQGMIGGGAPPPPPMPTIGPPAPPPLPNQSPSQIINNVFPPASPQLNNIAPPPPPPPMPTGGPPLPPPLPGNGANLSKQLPSEMVAPPPGMSSPSDTLRRNQPRPDYIADIANHAHTLKRVNHHPRSQADLQAQNFPVIQLRQTGFHPKMQGNDEMPLEDDVTDKIEKMRVKTPSPPKFVSNGGAMSPIDQSKTQTPLQSPVVMNQQSPRPFFQQPMQQSPRPLSQTPTPSPTINNQQRMFRPQMSPVSPATPEINRQKYSPPRTSPPREVASVYQPQVYPAPNTQQISPNSPIVNSQQKVFRPQSTPTSPEIMGPIFNQTRISPPREVVTVYQPQVFQDMGPSSQNERTQSKHRLPGLKMPEEKEPGPRPTPPSSASLRQAPAPWLSAQRHSISKEVPPWASREDSTPPIRTIPANAVHISARIVPMHMESYQHEEEKQQATSQQGRVRIIPIRLEGSDDVVQPQSSQQNKYDQNDSSQMYQQHMPMMQQQVPMFQQQVPMMQQQVPMMQQQVPMMQQQVPMMQQQLPMMQQQQVPSMQRPQTPGQQMPPMGHPMMMVPQSPRGWSQANSSPVQSRSFRVLQKITGSDQEASEENTNNDSEVLFLMNRVQQKKDPAYREMMSPPVYTVPAHPPQFYMRSPTYDSNGHPGESEY